MKRALIGYTGTVGQTLCDMIDFQAQYNSKNIQAIRGQHFDELYIAGIPGDKSFANRHPQEDLDNINVLLENLVHVTADNVYLISTISVTTDCPYGKHRLYAEKAISRMFWHTHIIRLPGLVGKHIKKNFIYDIAHPVCKFMYTLPDPILLDYYTLDGDRYWLNADANENDAYKLLSSLNCTALQFTNPSSTYQYCDLDKLDSYIKIASILDTPVLNICSTAISAEEICARFDIDCNMLNKDAPIERFEASTPDGIQLIVSKNDVLKTIRNYLGEEK